MRDGKVVQETHGCTRAHTHIHSTFTYGIIPQIPVTTARSPPSFSFQTEATNSILVSQMYLWQGPEYLDHYHK